MSGSEKVPSIAEVERLLEHKLHLLDKHHYVARSMRDALAVLRAVRPLLEELRDRRIGDAEAHAAATDYSDTRDPETADIDRLLAPEPAK